MMIIAMKSTPPEHLADTCFLSHFWGHFYIEGSKSGIFGQQMLTKISENVFHTLNSSHLKSHVSTTNRSWKNLFFTPLAHKVPIQNLTFICFFSKKFKILYCQKFDIWYFGVFQIISASTRQSLNWKNQLFIILSAIWPANWPMDLK